MRVEITDELQYRYVIDSSDYALIGKWFAEHAQHLMSADTRFNHPVSIDIWPSGQNTEVDLEILQKAHLPIRDVDALHEFVKRLLEVSQIWQDAEMAQEKS